MRHTLAAIVLISALVLPVPPGALARKKKEDAPPPIEFTILRDGKPSGTFSYKMASFSGKHFSSSTLEMKTRKGTLAVMTHVERDESGKLVKYRKWVGNEGARPNVIAFWQEDNLRIVSKLKKARFKRNLSPPEGFIVLDQLGFHLYGDLAKMWSAAPFTDKTAFIVHKGSLDKVTFKSEGLAILTNKQGEEVQAQAVKLKSKSFNLTFFVGEKPAYLGFMSKHVLLVRKGWNFVRIDAGESAVPDEQKSDAIVNPESEKAENPESEKAENPEKEPADKDLPPLPE
jgi:hypothetical protein